MGLNCLELKLECAYLEIKSLALCNISNLALNNFIMMVMGHNYSKTCNRHCINYLQCTTCTYQYVRDPKNYVNMRENQ